jgi:hypothetical protein
MAFFQFVRQNPKRTARNIHDYDANVDDPNGSA